ncbi:MAG: hypothetical protein ACREJC_03970 [Tepidisphaeraceae bacterium]
MAYESHSFPFEDSLARQNNVYEVEFADWGVRTLTPPAVDPNLQWPPPGSRPIASSCAAIAIGPRSTMDRCWVSWDRSKKLNVPPADVLLPSEVISLPRIVTCNAPLLFPQSTTKEPTMSTQSWWDAMQFGTAYVFPFGPKPDNNTLGDGSGTVAKGGGFGQTTIVNKGANSPFQQNTFLSMFNTAISNSFLESPFLHLMLYAKLPAFSPPTLRAPMARELLTFTDENAGVPKIAGGYPIFGRRHVGVSLLSHNFSGTAGGTLNYYVGLIRNINENPIGSFTPVFEVKVAEALAVPINTPVNFSIPNPCADYITIWASNTVGGVAEYALTVVAED